MYIYVYIYIKRLIDRVPVRVLTLEIPVNKMF